MKVMTQRWTAWTRLPSRVLDPAWISGYSSSPPSYGLWSTHVNVLGQQRTCQFWRKSATEALCVLIQRGKYLVRIVIFPSDGRNPCQVCTATQHCCCLLWGRGGARIINICGVMSRITRSISLNWCPYNHNKMYVHVSCKIFHTSNVNVLTKEVHVISKAIRIKVNYMGLFSPGFWVSGDTLQMF